jgi:hypothetical protein
MSTTVDRSNPVRNSELAPSALLVQHMLEYASADSAGVQRAIDFLNSVCDYGYVAHHMTGNTFRVQDVEPTQGNFQWATSGTQRGLFDPSSAAVPTMARISKAKRALIVYGTPKYQSSSTASNYDYYPPSTTHYTDHANTVVRVLDEAVNRGTPFHAVSLRQELKGQPNRSFGPGGGGQSEVDIYNAVYQAVKSKYPTVELFGPHLGLGGSASGTSHTVTDHQRPLQWAWDRDFFTGWLQRADGWDRIMLDWGPIDYGANGAAEGVGNPDLVATWIANWRLICSDAYEMMAPYIDATHLNKLGFIEFYGLDVNLNRWNIWTVQQKAAFTLASLINVALGGAGPVFGWQKEGGYDTTAGFQDWFGWFRKTAIAGGPNPQTGTTYPEGDAVKLIHDLLPPGTPLFEVTTNDPRVYGVATPTQTLVVNLNSTNWSDTVEGQQVTLAPYAWTSVAYVPPPPPVVLTAPTGLVGTAGRMFLSWDPVEGANHYNIFVSGRIVKSVTETSAVIVNVAPNTTLKFGVRAVAADGTFGPISEIYRKTMI